MKKVLVLTMCCISLFLFSCKKEAKDTEQFVGSYSGNITATMTMTMMGISTPTEPIAMPASMVITKGDEDDRIVATCTIDTEVYTIGGTVDGNVVTFDPMTRIMGETINESSIELNLSINLSGTLVGNIMTIDGTTTGTGTANTAGMEIPITITGTTNGTMTKI